MIWTGLVGGTNDGQACDVGATVDVMGRNLVLSAAQDGVTVVTEDIVVIMDVVGTVVEVTIVGIMVGDSQGSACVVKAGIIVVEVLQDAVCDGWVNDGDGIEAGALKSADGAGFSARRTCSNC